MVPGSKRWTSLYFSERMAKITLVKFSDLNDIAIAIPADENVDNPEEKLIPNAIRSLMAVNLEGETTVSGGHIKLSTMLDLNVGEKRPITSQPWEGIDWDPRGEVPLAVVEELTKRLGTLLAELRPLENAYRCRLVANGRVRARNMGLEVILGIKPSIMFQTEAINVLDFQCKWKECFW